jgi:hypothetical protein
MSTVLDEWAAPAVQGHLPIQMSENCHVNGLILGAFWHTISARNQGDEKMDTSKLSISELEYIIKDCQETLAALPNHPEEIKYLDQINDCVSELNRR